MKTRSVGPYEWEVPIGEVAGMLVPGRVFADDEMLAEARDDRALEQVANVATLPGIVRASYAMPDIHWGYGFAVGGVAATDASLARAAARDVMILGAIGFPLDGELENFAVTNAPTGGVRADQNLMASLDSAVQRRAVGEAGLLAALIAGGSPARLDAPSLSALLRAMRTAGLEADARNFAVEALLAGAPPAAATPTAPRPAAPAR